MRTVSSIPALGRLMLALAAAALLACGSDGPTDPGASQLEGLSRITNADSMPQSPPSGATQSPGRFHGTVYGYVPGGDTLATRVALPGVRVTAYAGVRAPDGAVSPGAEAASVVTDAGGAFALPSLPGGEYVVTIVPPSGSGYRGAWATATAWEHSGDQPWFVMLARTANE